MSRNRQGTIASHEDPGEILGVAPYAGDEEIRAAYLRKVKENPPDRSPADFLCCRPTPGKGGSRDLIHGWRS